MMSDEQTKQNLRTFLSEVATKDGLTVIGDRISPDLDLAEVLWEFEDIGQTDAVWFEDVENLHGESADQPVVSNLFADRQWCALALNSTVESVGLEYHAREQRAKQIDPIQVDATNAPVRETVTTGGNLDLTSFPIVTHHKNDAGPYITAGVCIIPSPPEKDWGYNAGTLRIEYRGPDEVGLFMIPGRHSASYYDAYEEAGLDMPMAIVIGHHPTFHLGCQTLHTIDVDEYKVVGGTRGSALPLTTSETWGEDLLIPADAEIVIEGTVAAGERITEGPFGEYTRYYGDQSDDRHRMDLTAVNQRDDAIYHDIFAGHPDHLNLGGIPIEGRIYESVSETISSVENVHLPPTGNCRQHCYVSIDKRKRGQGKNAIVAALAPYDLVKHVIVVDDDVDIFDERDVLWAVATRSQWDKDLIVSDGFSSITLDPSADNYEVTARGGIDATVPLDAEFPRRLEPADRDVSVILESAHKTDQLPLTNE